MEKQLFIMGMIRFGTDGKLYDFQIPKEQVMDKADEQILKILQGNARISFQKLGEAIGLSRVAAKKRVRKMEKEGIIRGYNTCIYRKDEITMFIDIVTVHESFDEVLEYVSTRTAFVRQIFRITKKDHIHMIAVSDDIHDLKYLTRIHAL
ncbi:MAG: Lrp/AsnC family transcriptional regulator [Lachnospiraceae bacterium]|nr:Lrp/AsnC family transcriptional regulator [Lachnospiraceae bacterium]